MTSPNDSLNEFLREVEEYLACHGDRKAEQLRIEARGWRVSLPSTTPAGVLSARAAAALGMAIQALRDIRERAPGTSAFFDYDAFIMNELNPAFAAAKAAALPQPSTATSARADGSDWMARNVNDFAGHFLQRYEGTGSLRESMMWAFNQCWQGVSASPTSAKAARNWPDRVSPMSNAEQLLLGWREIDWPEAFDRRTAQIMADEIVRRLRATLPQPETVTTCTPATGTQFTIPGPWAPEGCKEKLQPADHGAPLDLDHIPADYAEAVEMLRRAKRDLQSASGDRTYLDFCLRLNAARSGMNNGAICKVLDEIDAHFHNMAGGH